MAKSQQKGSHGRRHWAGDRDTVGVGSALKRADGADAEADLTGRADWRIARADGHSGSVLVADRGPGRGEIGSTRGPSSAGPSQGTSIVRNWLDPGTVLGRSFAGNFDRDRGGRPLVDRRDGTIE
jgi:hypothetical protein